MSIDVSEVAIKKVEGDELKQWPAVLVTSANEDRLYWETKAWLVDLRLHLACGKLIFTTWCVRGFNRSQGKEVNWAVRTRAASLGIKFVEVFDCRSPLDCETMRLIEQVNKETKEQLKKNIVTDEIVEDFCESREAVLV